MKPINASLRHGVVLSLLILSASACSSNNNDGGGNSSTTPAPTTPVVIVSPNQEDKFGANFGAAFRAAANGEPFAVQDGDLIPISFTAEPEVVN